MLLAERGEHQVAEAVSGRSVCEFNELRVGLLAVRIEAGSAVAVDLLLRGHCEPGFAGRPHYSKREEKIRFHKVDFQISQSRFSDFTPRKYMKS